MLAARAIRFGLLTALAITAPASAQSAAPHEHAAAAPLTTVAAWAKGAQLFDGLGDFHRRATTSSSEAQRYFDQGMRLVWAFNHDEATRSFAKAAELDPRCAACFWGVALTLGPNYNMPMMSGERARVGWAALASAQAMAKRASPVERALIAALARRYTGSVAIDPSNSAAPLSAYVTAMRDVAKRFPADGDVQTLLAEALMNTNPWKLWNADGTPGPGTPEIVALLRSTLAKYPLHPGANHYLIHALEASPRPGDAVAAAEALKGMMPAAGHLEHMPSHIMQRVGRYDEAAEANRKGAAADLAYLRLTAPPDYYPMYLVHNFQFLAFAAAMDGRAAETIAAARDARRAMPDTMLVAMPGLDWSLGYLYEGLLRFGRWDEMLAESAPDPQLIGLTLSYLQSRAVALAATGKVSEAEAAAAAADAVIAGVAVTATQGMNAARPLYSIGQLKARARIAAAKGRSDETIALLQQAVGIEDGLAYNEPEDTFFPVRHLLGTELLKAGRASEAEAVFRADLVRHPANGWALHGLAGALAKQGKADEAASAAAELSKVWSRSDVRLTAAAF